MKKSFIIPMAACLILSASSLSTFAKTNPKPSKITTSAGLTTEASTISAQIISGTVIDVSENEVSIKANDGTSYWFPTIGFSGLDAFKNLNLKAGMMISVEGIVSPVVPLTLPTDTKSSATLSAGAVIQKVILTSGSAIDAIAINPVISGTASLTHSVDLKSITPVLTIESLDLKDIKNTDLTVTAVALKIHPDMKLLFPEEITSGGITVKLSGDTK